MKKNCNGFGGFSKTLQVPPEGGPKGALRVPKGFSGSKRSQRVPKGAQMVPQMIPKGAPRVSKGFPRVPKRSQRVPKGCPKGFPKCFQACQRGPKRVLKGCPKVFPKGSQTVPTGSGLGCLMTGCLWVEHCLQATGHQGPSRDSPENLHGPTKDLQRSQGTFSVRVLCWDNFEKFSNRGFL